jgi:hypothetical protein
MNMPDFSLSVARDNALSQIPAVPYGWLTWLAIFIIGCLGVLSFIILSIDMVLFTSLQSD